MRILPALILAMAASATMAQAPAPASGPSENTRAQIGISPQMFEVSLDGAPGTQAYRLHNLGQRDTTVRIRAVHWTLDAAGEMVLLPPEEASIDRWLVVNPLQLSLPAGSTRAVRFSLRPPPSLPPGEYRAALVFEEQPQAPEAGAGAGTMTLATRFRITSAIYASLGEVRRSGRLDGVELRPDRLVVHATGTGNGHVRAMARYRVLTADDDSETEVASGELARVPILPDLGRAVHSELPAGVVLAPGRYRVEITGSLGESPLNWSGPAVVAKAD